MSFISQTGWEWEGMGINFCNGSEWELNLRHDGNGIGNGNELIGIGGNGNVASYSRTSLVCGA